MSGYSYGAMQMLEEERETVCCVDITDYHSARLTQRVLNLSGIFFCLVIVAGLLDLVFSAAVAGQAEINPSDFSEFFIIVGVGAVVPCFGCIALRARSKIVLRCFCLLSLVNVAVSGFLCGFILLNFFVDHKNICSLSTDCPVRMSVIVTGFSFMFCEIMAMATAFLIFWLNMTLVQTPWWRGIDLPTGKVGTSNTYVQQGGSM